jgi:hypothetical protein
MTVFDAGLGRQERLAEELSRVWGRVMTMDNAEGRARIADGAFLELLGLTGSVGHFALCTRRAIAAMCHMPPEHILPTDSPEWLSKQMVHDLGREWDSQAFKWALEDALGENLEIEPTDIPPLVAWRLFWWHGKAPPNVGERIVRLAHNIERRLEHGE